VIFAESRLCDIAGSGTRTDNQKPLDCPVEDMVLNQVTGRAIPPPPLSASNHPAVKALCVVPQGMEEGTELLIEGREFGLMTGQVADFRFFCSAVRSGDTPGQIVPDAERQLEETSLLEVELPTLPDMPAGQVVPVRIESVVTELGTLELWMKHVNSGRRWKIEFQVRTE
jgi:hypothetical protein